MSPKARDDFERSGRSVRLSMRPEYRPVICRGVENEKAADGLCRGVLGMDSGETD